MTYTLQEGETELYQGKIYISDLIALLQAARAEYGDLPVYIFDGDDDTILDQIWHSPADEANHVPSRLVLT